MQNKENNKVIELENKVMKLENEVPGLGNEVMKLENEVPGLGNEVIKSKRVAIINLGCKVNKYESDSMAEKLQSAGMVIVEPESCADVYIVNTCSVTNMAQRKSRQMLRRAKKRNPDAVIIAAGCYVNAEHDVLLQENFVDVLVGNNRKNEIVQVVEECLQQREQGDYYLDINHTKEYEEMGSLDVSIMNHQRAYIKIQDGCNQFCSYCIIPYTRGRVRSRNPQNILKEIDKLAGEGIKEFVLTGIHISSYGIDFASGNREYDEVIKDAGSIEDEPQGIKDLGDLIYAIEQLPEVRRIRLGSLEPRIITKEFLEKVGKSDKLCPHFHLSLQSACNDTLKRMNRKYTIEEFMEKCELLRMYFDKPAITTDVIVGFPGETEDEFKVTLSNLEQLNLYEIHVFKYSVRSGTVAEKMPDQIPEEVKNRRSDILLEMTARQKTQYELALLGSEAEVLVEEVMKNIDDINDLPKARVIETDMSGDGLKMENETVTKEEKKYYTGHTKRYVKVAIPYETSIVNKIVKVKLD